MIISHLKISACRKIRNKENNTLQHSDKDNERGGTKIRTRCALKKSETQANSKIKIAWFLFKISKRENALKLAKRNEFSFQFVDDEACAEKKRGH